MDVPALYRQRGIITHFLKPGRRRRRHNIYNRLAQSGLIMVLLAPRAVATSATRPPRPNFAISPYKVTNSLSHSRRRKNHELKCAMGFYGKKCYHTRWWLCPSRSACFSIPAFPRKQWAQNRIDADSFLCRSMPDPGPKQRQVCSKKKKKADKRRSGAFDADHHHSVYVHVHAVHETRREFVFLLLTKASKETHCRLDRSIRRDENALCKTNPLELRRISGPCNHARISHSKTQTTTTTRSYVSNHIT